MIVSNVIKEASHTKIVKNASRSISADFCSARANMYKCNEIENSSIQSRGKFLIRNNIMSL